MKDAATIMKELSCDEATVNSYRNEVWIEYDHTNLVLHLSNGGHGVVMALSGTSIRMGRP